MNISLSKFFLQQFYKFLIMWIYIVMCCFFILVNNTAVAQEDLPPIVSSTEVIEGGSLNVTCDALRAGVPLKYTTISRLSIRWRSDQWETKAYATYRLYIHPYNMSFQPNPARNWTFSFSGSLQGTSDRPNNSKTMKIEMVVNDAKCSDTGSFICSATYLDESDYEQTTSGLNNFYINSNFVESYGIFLDPQYKGRYGEYNSINPEGSIVTLECDSYGPKQLNIIWKFFNNSAELRSYTPLNIEYFTDELMYSNVWMTSCYTYFHRSSIRFQTEKISDGLTYACVTTLNNNETIVGNMTIHTKPTIIVSPTVIQEGTNFTVRCNALRANVPETAKRVDSLEIKWTDGIEVPVSLAEHWANYSFFSNLRATNLASFSAGGFVVDSGNNVDSVYIKMSFYDAKCSDSGVYICKATYTDFVDGNTYSTYENQSVDTFTGLVPESVTLNPQHNLGMGPHESVNPAGSDVNLTCTVTGPEYATIKWKINNTYEVRGEDKSDAINSTKQMCVKYRHWSTLRHQILIKNSGNVYTIVCVATENLKETTVGNMTIYIKNESKVDEPNISYKSLESDDLVSPGDISEGGSFTVTCDASRAGVPENVTTILVLSIDKSTAMKTQRITYATYKAFVIDNITQAQIGRTWNIDFFGADNLLQGVPHNRNTMMIHIFFNDSNSEDTGFYFCTAEYLNSRDETVRVYKYQYVPKKNDLSFLYYVVPIAALVVVAAVVGVCIYKVRRKRAVKRRFNVMTLPALNGQSLYPPSMDSNGYLLPVDPNGGYAQISDTTYSENYYSSINELDFMKEADGQSEVTSGLDENQGGDVDSLSDAETKTDLKFDNKTYRQLDAKSDGHVDRTVDDKLEAKSEGQVDRTEDDKLDVNRDGEIDFKTIGHLDRKTDGQLDKETDVQLEKTKYVELDIKRNEGLDIKKDTEQKTSTNKPLDKDQQNESTPADGLNDYAKLYDTPGNVLSPEVNTYVTLKF